MAMKRKGGANNFLCASGPRGRPTILAEFAIVRGYGFSRTCPPFGSRPLTPQPNSSHAMHYNGAIIPIARTPNSPMKRGQVFLACAANKARVKPFDNREGRCRVESDQ